MFKQYQSQLQTIHEAYLASKVGFKDLLFNKENQSQSLRKSAFIKKNKIHDKVEFINKYIPELLSITIEMLKELETAGNSSATGNSYYEDKLLTSKANLWMAKNSYAKNTIYDDFSGYVDDLLDIVSKKNPDQIFQLK